jgi:serine/threonine protein kinase
MPMQLRVITGLERGRVLNLQNGDILQLGCSQNLEITSRFRDAEIARVHCEIQVRDNRVIVQDGKSPYGTFVNGRRIDETELQPGDVIKMGRTELRFTCDEGEVAPPAAPRLTPEASNPAQDTKDETQHTYFGPGPGPRPKGEEILTRLVGKDFVHFHIKVLIGQGYWGRVFEALDKRTNKRVAVKVFRPEFGEHAGRLKRYGLALKAIVPIQHPNLLAYFGAGKAGDFCWASSEFIAGKSLTQIIRRNVSTGKHDWRQALQIGLQLARALDALHSRQMFHLSLTPQNVLVCDSTKEARLGDLLLALSLQGNLIPYAPQLHHRLEETACLAPEQLEAGQTLDARTDLYALGVLLYQLLTGQPPFPEDTCEEMIEQIRHGGPEPARSVNAETPLLLDQLVMRLLAKRPCDRYANASVVAKVLQFIPSKCEK